VNPRRSAFTLVELLVVIAVITVLSGLTVAGVGVVRRSGQVARTGAIMQKMRTGIEVARIEGFQAQPLIPGGLSKAASWSTGTRHTITAAALAAAFKTDDSAQFRSGYERFWREVAAHPIHLMRKERCRVLMQDRPGLGPNSELNFRSLAMYGNAMTEAAKLKGFGKSSWNYVNSNYAAYDTQLATQNFLDAWGNDILAIPQDAQLVLMSGGPNRLYDDGPRAVAEVTATPLGSPDVSTGVQVVSGSSYKSDNIIDGNFLE
jgi:prepilin-type N-terminal cleavage/methylation domain-containing protein